MPLFALEIWDSHLEINKQQTRSRIMVWDQISCTDNSAWLLAAVIKLSFRYWIFRLYDRCSSFTTLFGQTMPVSNWASVLFTNPNRCRPTAPDYWVLPPVWASYKWCNSPCWEVQMSVSESSVKFSEECSVFWHWHDQRNNQLVMLATLKWSEYNQDLFLYSITPTWSCLLLIINNIYNIDNRDKYVSQYH